MNCRNVLILIILEYIYITGINFDYELPKCLNPYYTGIHLHIMRDRWWAIKEKLVLILIILEYIYI